MKPLLIDLTSAIGKIEQNNTFSSYAGKQRISKEGMTLTIISPSMVEENFGFEPSQSVQIYGAENIQSMAKAILAFCEAHFNEWEEQQKNKN